LEEAVYEWYMELQSNGVVVGCVEIQAAAAK
jgi:hypothetical protein